MTPEAIRKVVDLNQYRRGVERDFAMLGHLDGSGDGPHDPGMEERMRRVEEAVARIDERTQRMVTADQIAELKGVIVAQGANLGAAIAQSVADMKVALAAEVGALNTRIGEANTAIVGETSKLAVKIAEEAGALKETIAERPSHAHLWVVIGVIVAVAAAALGAVIALK